MNSASPPLGRPDAIDHPQRTVPPPPAVSAEPTASRLLETPGALLSRGHLRELGLKRRGVDAAFRELPTVVLPGYSKPMIRVVDYLELIERSIYRGDRVRRS